MASKADVDRRRREMCNWVFRDVPPSVVAERLADKYNVQPSTIKSDWSNRDNWLPELFDIQKNEADKIIFDLLAEQKTLKGQLWQLHNNADNDSVRLGSLKELGNMNKDLLNFVIETGFIERQPDKIELTGKDGKPIEFDNTKEKVIEKMQQLSHRKKKAIEEEQEGS